MSRACLGKKIIFVLKVDKKYRFLTIKLISIRRVVVKGSVGLEASACGVVVDLAEVRQKPEGVRQPQRSVVVEVVLVWQAAAEAEENEKKKKMKKKKKKKKARTARVSLECQ